MILNYDCLRDVLLALEENLSLSELAPRLVSARLGI